MMCQGRDVTRVPPPLAILDPIAISVPDGPFGLLIN
jgi:hypothetical protein